MALTLLDVAVTRCDHTLQIHHVRQGWPNQIILKPAKAPTLPHRPVRNPSFPPPIYIDIDLAIWQPAFVRLSGFLFIHITSLLMKNSKRQSVAARTVKRGRANRPATFQEAFIGPRTLYRVLPSAVLTTDGDKIIYFRCSVESSMQQQTVHWQLQRHIDL